VGGSGMWSGANAGVTDMRTNILRILVGIVLLGAVGMAVALDRSGRSNPRHFSADAVGFRFTEVAREIGIDFVHTETTLDPRLDNVAPHVAGLGASVSVTDVNNNGWPDLYFTTSRFGEPNALYLNQGDGTFREGAAEAGIADVNISGRGVSMGAVWGDYDNSGYEDLLVYRYGYLQLFRNRGDGTFEDVTGAAGLEVWMNANSAVWLDYNRDGHLDLYVGAFFREEVDLWNLTTTRIMQNSYEFAGNGGRNRLFRNRGDGTFEDVTEAMGVGSTRWTTAVGAADFNDNGWPDLYLANDYGPEELFLNQEGRGFVLARVSLENTSKSGMSVSLGDVYNRGRHDVFVTNISVPGYIFHGNSLRMNLLSEVGRMRDVARGIVADAGWAWGAQFADFDNDGLMDLFVVNGFISADPSRDYWYGLSKVAGSQGILVEDAANWSPMGTLSLSGYERSRVLLNVDGEFVDVAEAVGVDDRYDGRGVAVVDLFNRGVLDVVVANQKAPALVYRNMVEVRNNWVQFRLEGTRSNRSAIGADVIVDFGNARQRQTITGGMGFASQNDRRLHFGLGDARRVDRVEIRWPSGELQVLRDLGVNKLHTIREP
jgi:enediyne biosynthesis protein E4